MMYEEDQPVFPGSKLYPIHWIKAELLFKTRRKTMLGICGYSKRVFAIASPRDVLRILVAQDLYIGEGQNGKQTCEEGARCLDFDCPLNKTNWRTYKAAFHLRGKGPEKFGQTMPINKDLEVLKEYQRVVDESGRIVISKKL